VSGRVALLFCLSLDAKRHASAFPLFEQPL
jgi:hypothetical protein